MRAQKKTHRAHNVMCWKGGHENLLESGKDKRHQYANQRFYIDKGKCLQVIK